VLIKVFAARGLRYTLHTILKPLCAVLSELTKYSIGAKAGRM